MFQLSDNENIKAHRNQKIQPFYLMESKRENERLKVKTDFSSTREQLIQSGFHKLRNGAKIVDAGCGVGMVSKVMCKLLKKGLQKTTLHLIDYSSSRITEARKILIHSKNYNFVFHSCDLAQVPLLDGEIDFIFCRFVFEYLNNQEAVFKELLRILKPGGKLVIGDLDHNCLNHYPLPTSLESQFKTITDLLEKEKMFDFYAGRKIYFYFHKWGLKNITVRLSSHHLFYGKLKKRDFYNWHLKLDQIGQIIHQHNIQLPFKFSQFRKEFLSFLTLPQRFSYTPLIMVDGLKGKTT